MATQQPARKKGQGSEYQIKPKQKEKFRPSKIKEIIRKVMQEKLEQTQTYNPNYNDLQALAKAIADLIQYFLKYYSLKMPRYKYLAQVIIGQNKGQGVQVGGRCFWDFDTDYIAQENYQNEQIFCVVMVYGVYLY